MSEANTYQGSCHCGAVRYDVTTDLAMTIDCNCSSCHKRGHVLTFVPPTAFTLKAGQDATSEYRWNHKVIAYKFCNTCGVCSYAEGKMPDGSPMVAVNVRCLEGVDLSKLTIQHVDGKSF